MAQVWACPGLDPRYSNPSRHGSSAPACQNPVHAQERTGHTDTGLLGALSSQFPAVTHSRHPGTECLWADHQQRSTSTTAHSRLSHKCSFHSSNPPPFSQKPLLSFLLAPGALQGPASEAGERRSCQRRALLSRPSLCPQHCCSTPTLGTGPRAHSTWDSRVLLRLGRSMKKEQGPPDRSPCHASCDHWTLPGGPQPASCLPMRTQVLRARFCVPILISPGSMPPTLPISLSATKVRASMRKRRRVYASIFSWAPG